MWVGVVFLSQVCCLFSKAAAWDPDYELVWEDNFDFLDFNKWDHEVTAWGGGNGEFQVYTPDSANSYTKDGKLFIKSTLLKDNINPLTGEPFGEDFLYNGDLDLIRMYGKCTQSDNFGCRREGQYGLIPPIMSGRLRSYQRFAFRYGRVEIRAKMPVGDWMWPAMWLLPEDWIYGGWPRSGEIDITESRGNRDLFCWGNSYQGIQHMGSTLHWGMSWDQNRYYLTGKSKFDFERNYGDYFHNYTLDWSENGLRFIIDGDEFYTIPSPLVDENPNWKGFYEYGAPWRDSNDRPWDNGYTPKMTPFDERFHLILNVAVGGTNGFFSDDCVNQGGAANKPWRNGEPNAVDKFWNANNQWYPTWANEGDNSAMQIDYIKVYQRR